MKLCVVVLVAWAAGSALGGCSSDRVDATLGARCTGAADCTDRCLPAGADFPGGMCSRDCMSDSECPSEARCASTSTGVCLYSCRDDGDCSFLGSVNGQKWTCQTVASVQLTPVNVCLGPGAMN
jgi:hypothetical protein